MPGAGRGLRAAGRRPRVGRDPGQGAGGRRARPRRRMSRARLPALLEELVTEGRKVRSFSQFVEMLRLIERDIAARGWGYAMLHGATRDRDAQVEALQSGDLPLFPASLEVGGTGVNLTAAGTAFVYDPRWNPAAERRAMDGRTGSATTSRCSCTG